MEQLALFGPPMEIPEMTMYDIPVATDIGGYGISLRGSQPPVIKEIDGVHYEVSASGHVICMELRPHVNGSVRFSDIPHAHWKWHAYRDGDYKDGVSESRDAAHQEILKFWKEDIK